MKKYSWKNAGFNANVQRVGEELEGLEKTKEITNKNVLEYAKNNKNSELYKCFEWDNTIAGEKYRLRQASQIITSISFVIEEEPLKKQKVYYSIKSKKEETRIFKNIKDIIENDDEYSILCEKAKNELETCKNNYEELIKRQDLKEIIFEIYKNI